MIPPEGGEYFATSDFFGSCRVLDFCAPRSAWGLQYRGIQDAYLYAARIATSSASYPVSLYRNPKQAAPPSHASLFKRKSLGRVIPDFYCLKIWDKQTTENTKISQRKFWCHPKKSATECHRNCFGFHRESGYDGKVLRVTRG
jgi:hypothetical protein